MYQTGDRVKFLNETGGGVITKIVNKNMVHVENEDGFEIPVRISEIILDSGATPETKRSVAQFVKEADMPPLPEAEAPEVPTIIPGNDEPRFYLAFVPENNSNPIDGQTKIFLVNDCNCFLLYHYSHFDGKEYRTQAAGKLDPNTKVVLEVITQAEISELPDYCVVLLAYREQAADQEKPVSRRIHINPVRFYRSGSFHTNDFFKKSAMLFPLHETKLDRSVEELMEKETREEPKDRAPARLPQKEKPVTQEVVEVDLHIDELLDHTGGLSSKDMIDYQLSKFREEMEQAIKNQAVKRIVFIHGVGNGVLKQELRRELTYKYKKYTFQDASFREYGFGATMVILRG